MKKISGSRRLLLMIPHHKGWRWLLQASFLFLAACADRNEGCFDQLANNFSLEAEKSCSDCCVFPELRLEFRHRFIQSERDSVIRFAASNAVAGSFSTYTDALGQAFAWQELRYYISDVGLVLESGDTVKLLETVTAFIPQGLGDTARVTLPNNVQLTSNPSNFSRSVYGTFKGQGSAVKLVFSVGVSALANRADPARFPTTHPLGAGNSAFMYRSPASGYNHLRCTLQRQPGTPNNDPVEVLVNASQPLATIALPIAVRLYEGRHIDAVVRVDYAKWLQGLDLRSESASRIGESIVANLPESFQLLSITSAR